MKVKLIYCCLLLFVISCNQSVDHSSNYTVITIDNDKIEQERDISNLIDKVQIVSLKEEKGCFMGDIAKLEVDEQGNYIIYDRQTKRVNIFDSTGKFIKTLCKIGDGLNDALNITDFWITSSQDIEVYDFASMKIFQYDSLYRLKRTLRAKQFNHFRSLHRIPNRADYIAHADYGMHNAPFKGRLYSIAILDSQLNEVTANNSFDPIYQGIIWFGLNQYFFSYKDTLRFVKPYDNFVYNVTDKGIEKRYKIVYTKASLPDNILPVVKDNLKTFRDPDLKDPGLMSRLFKKYTRFCNVWLENDRYVYVPSIKKSDGYGQGFHSFIDKENNSVLFSAINIVEKQKYKLAFPPFQVVDYRRNELISILDGATLKSVLQKDSPLQTGITDDIEKFFLLKVKLNR